MDAQVSQRTFEDTWHRDGVFFHEEGNATELVAAEALNGSLNKTALVCLCAFSCCAHTSRCTGAVQASYDGIRFHKQDDKHDSRLRMAAMISQLDDKMGRW